MVIITPVEPAIIHHKIVRRPSRPPNSKSQCRLGRFVDIEKGRFPGVVKNFAKCAAVGQHQFRGGVVMQATADIPITFIRECSQRPQKGVRRISPGLSRHAKSQSLIRGAETSGGQSPRLLGDQFPVAAPCQYTEPHLTSDLHHAEPQSMDKTMGGHGGWW